MDVLSVGFVVLVVLLGGVIAFLAARLGRRLGKKRLSLFGLRPRHTAELMTVGAGVLIPLVTVLIVMAASRDAREWLIRGRLLAQDTQRLQSQVANLEAERASLGTEIRGKAEQVADLNRRLGRLQVRLRELDARAERYRAQSAEASRKAARLQARVAALSKDLATKLAELQSAQEKVERTRREYATLEREFQAINREREDAYRENLRLDQENAALSRDVAQAKREVEQLAADRQRLESDLATVRNAYEQTLRNFEADLERIKLQRDQRQAELKAAEEQLAMRTEQLRQSIGRTRTEPMIFAIGEELARYPVEARLTRETADAALRSLLRIARTRASERGAQPLPGMNQPAGLFDASTPSGIVTVAQQESEIVRSLTGRPENLVLIATASFNAFRGEYVPLTVRIYRNPIVFRDGETIAEGRIDGTRADDQVAKDVAEFVRQSVVDRAVRERMIPARGREDAFGRVEILETVQRIRDANRLVRLRAVADGDIRAADPLKIRFVIR
ncbi:MAG: DUF3084 domain-containing protein [Fimbriimonadales bacterium]|nr:DUF3084 domain-containing protein [Fimbriimonadales bacterium]